MLITITFQKKKKQQVNNKDFHIIAKEIISTHGIEIIAKKQFVNLLADLGAYKGLPALKTIVNELFKFGFGTFLYDLKQNNDSDIFEKCFNHRREFLSDGKFREDLTEYVYSSLFFALNLIDDIEEPKVKNPFSADASQNQKPASHKKRNKPALNLKKMLENLKNEYLETFTEIIVPKGKLAKASGYFSYDTLNKQYVLENKILILSKRLGEDLDWCKKEKEKILSKYSQSKSDQRTKFGCIISIPIILLVFIIAWSYNYIASAEERAEYEETILLAQQANANGNIIQAIELYSKAENEYDAGWRNGYYKEKAHSEAGVLSSKVYAKYKSEIDKALSVDNIIDVAYIMKTIPQSLVLTGEDWDHFKNTSTKVENSIDSCIKKELDSFLIAISKQGKLSDSEKERLNRLDTISPDNYWIKFIKTKEK